MTQTTSKKVITLALMALLGIAVGHFTAHRTKVIEQKSVYQLGNDDLFADWNCRERTTIEADGSVSHNWSATTTDLYVSSWNNGPKSCAEFKEKFIKKRDAS